MTFSTLLIANRGEIAVRIMRTATAMGFKTVAVYSDADADAAHVRAADVSVRIGPAAAADSYLDIDAILDAAQKSGAQAIHPGYGFLAENAEFATRVINAGLVFVGPPAAAIDAMGNKAAAKNLMERAGVPTIPGFKGAQDDETLIAEAKKIGVPVMVKAAAGGGGRGMRRVASDNELANAIASARSEASNAFGSGELILEKALDDSRHVEVQVFADQHGNAVHLGERDCSVQRRHQKLIEESPSPAVDNELRERMGSIAVAAAKAVNYVGAGTVEFLLDGNGEFYFLEMNTRLQVEHPVTELVTGLDLVEWQLRVAAGEPLPKQQSDISFTGHAIEVRLCAEDPMQEFLPQAGPVTVWNQPTGDGIRLDHCLVENGSISPFYDSMQGKLIAYGSNRQEAHSRLLAALRNTAILGTIHNTHFLQQLLAHPIFIAGDATTRFIEEHCPNPTPPDDSHELIAAALLAHEGSRQAFSSSKLAPELQHWNSTGVCSYNISFNRSDDSVGKYQCKATLTSSVICFEIYTAQSATTLEISIESLSNSEALINYGGVRKHARYSQLEGELWLFFDGVTSRHEQATVQANDEEQQKTGTVRATMDGKLLAVNVLEGQSIAEGELLATLEAMKMEHQITAPIAGTVCLVAAQSGSQLSRNQLIIEIEPKS